MTDRTHGSGSVQTCRRWGSPASQQALELHPQDLLPCFGHCCAKSEAIESMRMTRRERERQRAGEIGVSVLQRSPCL